MVLAATVPRHATLILLVTIVAACVTRWWNRPDRLTFLAGALLPVEAIDDVPLVAIEVVHVALVGLVAIRWRPRPTRTPGIRTAAVFVGLATALSLARLAFSIARDPVLPSVRYTAITLAALAAAGLIALCVDAHRPLLTGYVAGATASAGVALLQFAGVDLLHTADHGSNRFPGLADRPPDLSYHLVIALLIAGAAFVSATSTRTRRWAGAAVAPCVAALLVCGAQGGLGSVVVVAAVVGFHALPAAVRGGTVRLRPLLVWSAVLLVVIVGAGLLGAASVRGLASDPDKGYANEVARLRSLRYGTEQLIDRPLTGIGAVAYGERYDVRPHFIPLEAGVTSGVLGLLLATGLVALLAWRVVRGPTRLDVSGILGVALLGVLLTQALLTPAGPFAGVPRLVVLLVATLMVHGESRPFGPRPSAEPGPGATAVDRAGEQGTPAQQPGLSRSR